MSVKEKMAGVFGGTGFILYLICGVLQMVAIYSGLKTFGIPSIFAAPIAFPVSYIPLLGSGAAIYGAINGWGWPVPSALLLFALPLVLQIVFFCVMSRSSSSRS